MYGHLPYYWREWLLASALPHPSTLSLALISLTGTAGNVSGDALKEAHSYIPEKKIRFLKLSNSVHLILTFNNINTKHSFC